MINNKAKELKHGQMVLDMKESIKRVEKKDMEYYFLLMVLNILASFLIMKFMVMEFMNGLMVEFIKVIGNKIK